MTDSTLTSTGPSSAVPLWFRIFAGLGLAWNIFGLWQFITSLSATEQTYLAQGMTAEQAAVMLGTPGWMAVAFAVGTAGGALGCVLMLMRRAFAVPVFATSLAGYVVLYVGDIIEGVFAALGAPQMIVLSFVVAVAAGLFWLARRGVVRGLLV